MTNRKPFESRNYIAELVAAGFTITSGIKGEAETYGFVDSCVTCYEIHPIRSFEIVVGVYKEDGRQERENPDFPRFKIIYLPECVSSLESATSLKKTLDELGVSYSETPPRGEREKIATDLEKRASALRTAL
ncbi:MAG: hypothetical protein KC506_03480 [Nanoarchaeota archaeon]|nr:hypothetical protein [Nanoarchaeota archaeon]